MKEHELRYTLMTDAPYLNEWLLQEGVMHWFPFSEGKEMEDAAACWIGFSKFSCSLTALIDGVPVGIGTLFLMPYRKVAHHCLFKLIVDKKYRNQGIGTSLVKGFALVFGFGVITSLVSAVFISRVFLLAVLPEEGGRIWRALVGTGFNFKK